MTDQKVVLITGASSGIGRATAELLTSRGYRVFGTARNPETVIPVQASSYCRSMCGTTGRCRPASRPLSVEAPDRRAGQ